MIVKVHSLTGTCPMKMTKIYSKYCIGLFTDITTPANSTIASQMCKDILNDTTANNPTLHSKLYKSKILLYDYYIFGTYHT